MRALYVLMVMGLSGCSVGASLDSKPGEDATPSMTGSGVSLVRLRDGTRCAVAAMPVYGGTSVALSCDWQHE